MEEFLNRIHLLKDCYSKFSYNQVMGLDKHSVQVLCIKEKMALNEYLHSEKMRTKSITLERLSIIEEKITQEKAQRLEFLNSQFGKK